MYIDALHTEAALERDLNAWWPKVRPGGLVSGDDYGDADARSTGFLRFRTKAATGGIAKYTNWGVVRATRTFAVRRGVVVHTTWMRGNTPEGQSAQRPNACYRFPAWYIVKP